MLDTRIALSPAARLARIADPCLVLRDAGAPEPHAEQVRVLRDWRRDHMILWTRQGGKSTTGAALGLHNLIFNARPDLPSTVVVVSRAERQSGELFRKTRQMFGRLPYAPPLVTDSATVMETPDGGRVLAYPGSEESVRGLSAATLILLDEATMIPRELRDAVSPMASTTNAPIWAMATAKGTAGWFFDEWHDESLDFVRKSLLPWHQVPHLSREFIEKERRRMPAWMFAQEYECVFTEDGATQLISAAVIEACRNMEVSAIW